MSIVSAVFTEPLYQYINTAEFLRTPQENVKTGLTKNQLDIARQLSSRKLWCEQPEVYGVHYIHVCMHTPEPSAHMVQEGYAD